MTRRYIVAAELDRTEQQKLTEFAKANKLAWWHWISNVWLLVDRRGVLSVSEIRDALVGLAPSARCLVIELGPKSSWSGKGPNSENRNMFKWLKSSWKIDDAEEQ